MNSLLRKSFRRAFVVLQIISIGLLLNSAARAAGEVDPSFNAGLIAERALYPYTTVERIVAQPDGKILVGGYFKAAGKIRTDGVVRLNADGTVDTTFHAPPLGNLTGADYFRVSALAVQTDGKILFAGGFSTVGGVARPGIARLNADGSLDTAFNPGIGGIGSFAPYISDVKIAADGKIIIIGYVSYNAGANKYIQRLNADGTPDNTFNSPATVNSLDIVTRAEILPSGKILVTGTTGGNGVVYRLNADGSIDLGFAQIVLSGGNGNPTAINAVKALADGKFYVGGSFNTYNGFPLTTANLLRFNADGSLDQSFNAGNTGPNFTVNEIKILSGNQLLIAGNFTTFNGIDRRNVARVNADGSLDDSLAFFGSMLANDVAPLADGGILLGAQAGNSNLSPALLRLNANGTVAAAQTVVGENGTANKVFVQADGKILVGGNFTHVNNERRGGISRLNADGTIDTTFTPLNTTSVFFGIDARADGKILTSSSFGVIRLSANGAVDFGINGGVTYDAKFLPSGGALIGSNQHLRKISETGAFDPAFDVTTNGAIRRILIQPDGKFIIAGDFTSAGSAARGRIARINADGTLDTAFNSIGTNNSIFDAALQADGKIIIGGVFTGVALNTNYKYLARLNADGTLDTTFNPTIEGGVLSVKVQSNGRILVGGGIYIVNGTPRGNIARLNADGTLDAGFTTYTDNLVWSIDTQANGNIIIGGAFSRVNNSDRLGVARLLDAATTTRAPFDFDGDGKADVSVFRPANGFWYLLNSTNGFSAAQFGAPTDVIVPADYDNDGKTDLAVYRGGAWYIQRSTLGFVGIQFGEASDLPVPADYDNDGKADLAVFRPSTGIWYIQRSTLGFTSVQFGAPEDKPTLGDYDGDGKADVAVFRPSNGTWYRLNSSTGALVALAFGDAADKPAPADYDADGKTDIAVFRPSNGTWYLQRSTLGFTGIQFGASEDRPVPADYDGDGKADVAVFRPSTGAWYLNRSTSGFYGVQFGDAADKPAPGAYLR